MFLFFAKKEYRKIETETENTDYGDGGNRVEEKDKSSISLHIPFKIVLTFEPSKSDP